MTLDRRSLLALVATSNLPGDPRTTDSTRPASKSVSVRDFGARGDGVSDDTAAFNRATRAAEPWSTDLELAIHVPAGTYKISGTVYLRKGQSLIGEGHSSQIDARGAQSSTFVMGSSSSVGRRGQDPGGSPVRIENLRTLGGAARVGLIYTQVAGFSVRSLFMTACGVGLEIEGNDGILSDIYIDQCLNGVVLRKAQSIVITNSIWYVSNFGLSIGSDVRGLSVSNCVFSFTRYASINFEDGARNARACVFDSCVFLSNEQHESFLGDVHCRASNLEAHFNACVFRNWPRYVVNHAAGQAVALHFSACAFDASRASDDHNQSSSAAGIATGIGGAYRFSQCEFKWLMAPLASVGQGLKQLAFEGGTIDEMKGPRFRLSGNARPGSIQVRNLEGVSRIEHTPRGPVVIIPDLKGVDWRLRLSGRQNQPQGTAAFAREVVVSNIGGTSAIADLPGVSGIHPSPPLAIAHSTTKSAELAVKVGAFRSGIDLLRASLDTL